MEQTSIPFPSFKMTPPDITNEEAFSKYEKIKNADEVVYGVKEYYRHYWSSFHQKPSGERIIYVVPLGKVAEAREYGLNFCSHPQLLVLEFSVISPKELTKSFKPKYKDSPIVGYGAYSGNGLIVILDRSDNEHALFRWGDNLSKFQNNSLMLMEADNG